MMKINRANLKQLIHGTALLLCAFSATAATVTTEYTVVGHAPVVDKITFDKPTVLLGQSIVATAEMSDIDGDTLAPALFEWELDGSPIPGATYSWYTPLGGDVGHKLAVKVTPITDAQITAPAVGLAVLSDALVIHVVFSEADSSLSATANPVAHSPLTVTLNLVDTQKKALGGLTGLTLTGTGENTAPVFTESAIVKGIYTTTFTPEDVTQLTLGMAGLNGFTKTLEITPAAAPPEDAHQMKKPDGADLTIALGDASGPQPKQFTAVNGGRLSYRSSNPSVVDVDANGGMLTLKRTGTAIITVTEAVANGYASSSVSYTVMVNPALVSEVDSTLSVSPATPMAHSPVTVTLNLVDTQKKAMGGLTGLTLTGTGLVAAPAFTEESPPGTYTAVFVPEDVTQLTLGMAGLNGFTKTLEITPTLSIDHAQMAGQVEYALVKGTIPASLPTTVLLNHTLKLIPNLPIGINRKGETWETTTSGVSVDSNGVMSFGDEFKPGTVTVTYTSGITNGKISSRSATWNVSRVYRQGMYYGDQSVFTYYKTPDAIDKLIGLWLTAPLQVEMGCPISTRMIVNWIYPDKEWLVGNDYGSPGVQFNWTVSCYNNRQLTNFTRVY
jgi:hypothetical protein